MMMIFLNWPTHCLADCDVVWLSHRSGGERFARVGPGCRRWPASDDWRRHRARHSTAQNQRRVSRQACRAQMTMSQRVKWVNASVSIASVKRRIVANLLQSLSVKIVKKSVAIWQSRGCEFGVSVSIYTHLSQVTTVIVYHTVHSNNNNNNNNNKL